MDYQDQEVHQDHQGPKEEMCVTYNIIMINSNLSELVLRNICVKYTVDDTALTKSFFRGCRAAREVLESLDLLEILGPLDQRWVQLFCASHSSC